MVHASVRAVRGSLLFHTWAEALVLWNVIAARVCVLSMVLMPDHLHLALPHEREIAALGRALRAYAIWRNRARGESGPVFERGNRVTPVRGRGHEARLLRYIHLNPCRKGLVPDPLAWPFSTHRDAVGLALPPIRTKVPSPDRFHAFVSGDPDVRPAGTALPSPIVADPGRESLVEIHAAVSSLTRTPASRLRQRGPARDLLLRAARALTTASTTAIGDAFGVDPATARRRRAVRDADVATVARVLGDPRFGPLRDGDLRDDPSWRAYRSLR
jgi:hypothetical protein